MNNKYRGSVKDIKVIPGEEIVSQHCLLLIDMVFKRYWKKLKLWRLRESDVKEEFAKEFKNKYDGNAD